MIILSQNETGDGFYPSPLHLFIRLLALALQAQALALKRSGNANAFHRLIPRK